jgi:hypothetical protein
MRIYLPSHEHTILTSSPNASFRISLALYSCLPSTSNGESMTKVINYLVTRRMWKNVFTYTDECDILQAFFLDDASLV